MKAEIANKINLYLNKPEITECLKEYVEDEISLLFKQLEFTTDLSTIRYLQGRIFELRQFAQLRETALSVVDSERQKKWQSGQSQP